jgi:hypothetical protein
VRCRTLWGGGRRILRVMGGSMAATISSISRRVRRHQLIGRDWVPPGKKRTGTADQSVDQKSYQQLRGDVHAQQFGGSYRMLPR